MIYISLGITSSVCEVVFNLFIELVSGTFCDEVVVVLSIVLLPINSPVVSAVSWINLFETVFCAALATLVTLIFKGYQKDFKYVYH